MSNKVEIKKGLKFIDGIPGETAVNEYTVENITKSGEYCDVCWIDGGRKQSIVYPTATIDEYINISKVWTVIE